MYQFEVFQYVTSVIQKILKPKYSLTLTQNFVIL